jgi:hypothetical protein
MRPCRSLRSLHTVSLFECVRYIVYNVYVGRRGRQREQRAQERARAPRDRMARVQVSDEIWTAYRASLGTTPVSVGLGRLVEREVASHHRRTAPDADDVREAVKEARGVVDELVALIARLDEKDRAAA